MLAREVHVRDVHPIDEMRTHRSEGTLEVAVDFASHQLTDAPPLQVASR